MRHKRCTVAFLIAFALLLSLTDANEVDNSPKHRMDRSAEDGATDKTPVDKPAETFKRQCHTRNGEKGTNNFCTYQISYYEDDLLKKEDQCKIPTILQAGDGILDKTKYHLDVKNNDGFVYVKCTCDEELCNTETTFKDCVITSIENNWVSDDKLTNGELLNAALKCTVNKTREDILKEKKERDEREAAATTGEPSTDKETDRTSGTTAGPRFPDPRRPRLHFEKPSRKGASFAVRVTFAVVAVVIPVVWSAWWLHKRGWNNVLERIRNLFSNDRRKPVNFLRVKEVAVTRGPNQKGPKPAANSDESNAELGIQVKKRVVKGRETLGQRLGRDIFYKGVAGLVKDHEARVEAVQKENITWQKPKYNLKRSYAGQGGNKLTNASIPDDAKGLFQEAMLKNEKGRTFCNANTAFADKSFIVGQTPDEKVFDAYFMMTYHKKPPVVVSCGMAIETLTEYQTKVMFDGFFKEDTKDDKSQEDKNTLKRALYTVMRDDTVELGGGARSYNMVLYPDESVGGKQSMFEFIDFYNLTSHLHRDYIKHRPMEMAKLAKYIQKTHGHKISANSPIVVTCSDGHRSSAAFAMLLRMVFLLHSKKSFNYEDIHLELLRSRKNAMDKSDKYILALWAFLEYLVMAGDLRAKEVEKFAKKAWNEVNKHNEGDRLDQQRASSWFR